MGKSEQSVKDVIRRYTEDGYNAGDLDVIRDCVAEDMVVYGLEGVDGPVHGSDGYLEWVAGAAGAFPDLQADLNDLISEGNKVVAHWTMSGTHKGDFGDITATGKEVSYEGIGLMRVVDGEIAEKWWRPDELGLLEQLGVIE